MLVVAIAATPGPAGGVAPEPAMSSSPRYVPAADAPFFVVLNAGSGHGDAGRRQAELVAVLEGAGRRCQVAIVTHGRRLPAVAEQMAAQAEQAHGVLVACGGDGTLNAVAQQAWRLQLPFGIVPQGTFNYFGRTYGFPTDVAAAARLLLQSHVQPVQVGLVNDHVFLINASLGLYPQLLEDREAYKQRFGRSRWVALGAALATLWQSHRRLWLEIETEAGIRRLLTPTLVVANNPLQLEQVGIADHGALANGRLVAMALKPIGTLGLYGLVLRGAMSRLGEAERVIRFDVGDMRVRGRRRAGGRVKVAMDGEIHHLPAPLRFRVAPAPLHLLVPVPVPPGQHRGLP